MSNEPKLINKHSAFVQYTLNRIGKDKGLAASLRKADNPSTEHLCWSFLAGFNIPLDFEAKRLPYSTVAAAIARDKASANGKLTLGRALAMSYPDGHESKPAQARLRRLLSCDNINELCSILRQTLSLVRSRTSEPLDYALLLGQLSRYSFAPEKVNAQWAQQFYNAGYENHEGSI